MCSWSVTNAAKVDTSTCGRISILDDYTRKAELADEGTISNDSLHLCICVLFFLVMTSVYESSGHGADISLDSLRLIQVMKVSYYTRRAHEGPCADVYLVPFR